MYFTVVHFSMCKVYSVPVLFCAVAGDAVVCFISKPDFGWCESLMRLALHSQS